MKIYLKIVALLASILLLLVMPSAALPEAAVETPSTQEETPYQIDYTYATELISVYYHLYGNVLEDFTIINLTNSSGEEARFLVETEIEGYSSVAATTVDIAPGAQQEVRQNPRLIPESMEKLNAQRYADFLIRVTLLKDGEDELLLSESKEILLYSRRDYTWIDGCSAQENYDLLAVYITPNDPSVETLLRRAADYTSSGQIWTGYDDQACDEGGGVWDRLQAIWQAEKEYGLTYVSTTVTFTPEKSQRIRLPCEVLEQAGGNCVELVFLYASAVEAIQLEASFVLIPNHCYLAVRTDQENAQYYFIETTLIGQSDFTDAVNYAYQSWEADGPKVDAGEMYYNWVNVADAREEGILPVPWR